MKELNILNGLSAVGYIEDDIPALVEETLPQHRVTKLSPKEATPDEIGQKMAGIGPKSEPVVGWHGNSFTSFGDYSIDLFENAQMHGNPPSRSLFEMVAVAILKELSWGESKENQV